MSLTEVFNILFHLSSLALIFGILRQRGSFNYFISLALIASLLHLLAIYLQIGTPFGLFYGPVIYLAHGENSYTPISRKLIIKHLIPFVIFFLCYLVLSFAVMSSASWLNTAYLYYPCYFIAMLASLGSYSFIIFFENKRNTENELRKLIIGQLCLFNLIIASLIALLIMKMLIWPNYILGMDIKMLINSLLGITALFMASFLYKSGTVPDQYLKSVNLIEDSANDFHERYRDYSLDYEVLEAHALKINSFLLDTKLYLNTNLSLDLLSEKTRIPKHHLSQVLNIHLGKNFYQTIATYRIDYALIRLQQDHNITFESLAYECGFNSKTSFNKYFKELTGYTPSEYKYHLISAGPTAIFD